jgi:hypothetical protein
VQIILIFHVANFINSVDYIFFPVDRLDFMDFAANPSTHASMIVTDVSPMNYAYLAINEIDGNGTTAVTWSVIARRNETLAHVPESVWRNNPVGCDRFEDIVDRYGLKVRKPGTTDSTHGLPVYPNIARDFIPTAPNQLIDLDEESHYIKKTGL